MTRSGLVLRLARWLWFAGWPLRQALLIPVRIYRLTAGQVVGGNCRFYPSCSAYAEQAIARSGAVRGVVLTGWRVLRCSPLSVGGVDLPPVGRTWRALHGEPPGTIVEGDHRHDEVAA